MYEEVFSNFQKLFIFENENFFGIEPVCCKLAFSQHLQQTLFIKRKHLLYNILISIYHLHAIHCIYFRLHLLVTQ